MKHRTISIALVLLALLSAFLQAGCSEKETLSNNSDEDNLIVIGFSLGTLKEERWQKDRDIFIERAKELGAEVNLLSANADPEVQLSQIENLILQGVDVLVIVPEDAEAMGSLIEKAHQSGIKILSYDRMIKNSDVDFYISFDNEKVGEMQAAGVINIVGSGNFAYIGGAPTDNNAFLLKKGSMNVLKEKIDSGEIKLSLEEFTPEWKPELAYKTMKEYLENNSIDAVIAANDGTAFGVIQALKEKNLDGIVPVSGQDAELSACQRIAQGTQAMTVYKPIKSLATKAAEVAIEMAKGDTPESNSKINNGYKEVESYLIEPVFVDKSNLNETIIKDGFHTYEDVFG